MFKLILLTAMLFSLNSFARNFTILDQPMIEVKGREHIKELIQMNETPSKVVLTVDCVRKNKTCDKNGICEIDQKSSYVVSDVVKIIFRKTFEGSEYYRFLLSCDLEHNREFKLYAVDSKLFKIKQDSKNKNNFVVERL